MWNKVIDDWKTPVEYIDREAANLALAEQGFDWDKAKQALASVPAADVAPVVHGWWNANEICSLCGEKSTEGLDATIWNYWLPNYCPNCGAKMDGGEDND
jgi:hypothetical protein